MAFDRDETLRRAEKALRQGRLDAAIAEYARVVEEQPNDLATLNALGDLYVRAAQSDQALPLFMRVGDAYLREGFFSKAAGFYKKILKFTPNDEGALLKLADASIEQGLVVEARNSLQGVLARRRTRGDLVGADEIAVKLGDLDPHDLEAKLGAVKALARLKGVEAIPRLRAVANDLEDAGRDADATELLREIVGLDPRESDCRARVIRWAIAHDDVATARAYLTRQAVTENPSLVPVTAELELLDGSADAARDALRLWVRRGPDAVTAIANLARRLGERGVALTFVALEVAVDAASAAGRYEDASEWLENYVIASPRDVPALLRLVELAVDGALPDALSRAQALLVDAYLEEGRSREARFVSEDLLSRDPSNEQHRARLRRALEQLGEPVPDHLEVEALPIVPVPARPRPPAPEIVEAAEPEPALEPAETREPASAVLEVDASAPVPAEGVHVGAVALDDVTDDEGSAASEVDLSSELSNLSDEGDAPPAASPPSLDEVFAKRRDDPVSARQSGRELLGLAQTYRTAGLIEDAVAALQRALRDPAARLEAAASLGELYLERGDRAKASEWLAVAADASASDEKRRVGLLRRLVVVLEELDERERALAVWLEILTLAPSEEAHAKVAALVAQHGGESFTG